jgi:hypothetical protein
LLIRSTDQLIRPIDQLLIGPFIHLIRFTDQLDPPVDQPIRPFDKLICASNQLNRNADPLN